MIKDGFGQGYLFDNHWSATVMDGKEDLHPSLPSHPITTAPSSDPPLFIFLGPAQGLPSL